MRRLASGALEARIAAARARKPPVATATGADEEEDDDYDADRYVAPDIPSSRIGVEMYAGDDSDLESDEEVLDSGAVDGRPATPVLANAPESDDPRYGSDPDYGAAHTPCGGAEGVAGGLAAAAPEGPGVFSQPNSALLVVAHSGNFSGYEAADLERMKRTNRFEEAFKQRAKAHEKDVKKKKASAWTPAETEARKDYVAGQIWEQRYLNKPLPKYKTWARALRGSELDELRAQRERVEKARRSRPASMQRGAQEACVAVQRRRQQLLEQALRLPSAPGDEYDRFEERVQQIATDEGLLQSPYQNGLEMVRKEAYAEVARAPLLTEPNEYDKSKMLRLARNHDVPVAAVRDEYMDFMNDARRSILRAISLANAEKQADSAADEEGDGDGAGAGEGRQLLPVGATAERSLQAHTPLRRRAFARATRAELDEWMEEDAEAEYRPLFERETDLLLNSDAAYAVAEGDSAWVPTDMGTLKSCAGCSYPKVNWSVGRRNMLANITQADDDEAEAWVRNWASQKGSYKVVYPLFSRNRGEPCALWVWPSKPSDRGWWVTAKRIVELKPEIAIGGRGPANQPSWTERRDPSDPASPEYNFNEKFDADPLVAIKELGRNGATRTLMDQVVEAYWESAIVSNPNLTSSTKYSRSESTAKNMRVAMLRCFPDRGALGFDKIGDLLEFACWFHENITEPGTTKEGRVDLFLRLNCAPIMRGASTRNRGPEKSSDEDVVKVVALANQLHTRVGRICTYFEHLKNGLDMDVFQRPPSASLLLSGGGDSWMRNQGNLRKAKAALESAKAEHDAASAASPPDADKLEALRVKVETAEALLTETEKDAESGPREPSPEAKAAGRLLYDRWKKCNPPR